MTITITSEWKKNRNYGLNPHASAYIVTENSVKQTKVYKASGCGYDKESTVVADLLNDIKDLFTIPEGDLPYGLSRGDYTFHGGIGMTCYYRIMEVLGGKLEHITGTKTVDVWRITF